MAVWPTIVSVCVAVGGDVKSVKQLRTLCAAHSC